MGRNMKHIVASFFIAFSMYSKIPVPRPEWTKENMRYALCFFPWIGAVIGGIMVLWQCVGDSLGFGVIFQTVIMVLIPIVITGGIHLDGLLDTSDALSSFQPMERKLEILKDSHAGAFAIIIGISYFVLSFGVWSEVTKEMMRVLTASFVLSRSLSGLAVVCFRCAKNTGLANTFADMAMKRNTGIILVIQAFAAAAFMIWKSVPLGLSAVLGAMLTFLYYRIMSYRKFGGITGDLAGFFLQICELVMVVFVITAAKIFVG